MITLEKVSDDMRKIRVIFEKTYRVERVYEMPPDEVKGIEDGELPMFDDLERIIDSGRADNGADCDYAVFDDDTNQCLIDWNDD